MKKVAGKLKLQLAQFREMEAFSQFGSDLDSETKKTLDLGRRVTEVLKQLQYTPYSLDKEVTILYAVNNGYFNSIPVEKMADTETKFHKYMEVQGKDILESIVSTKELNEATEIKLKTAIEQFLQTIKE
jgi:F-type H+/Na+-transporting ATPase subunit alpha